MIELNNYELTNISGGAAVTATMLNAVSRLMTTVLLLGQIVGSAIKLKKSKNYC